MAGRPVGHHVRARARTRSPRAEAGVDAYALTHNETSTGVAMPIRRVAGADDGALVLVDATSAAGGIAVDPAEFDAYYFAPQKCFGSDGGLWLALLSPGRRRARSPDRGQRSVHPGVPVAADRDREVQAAADLQHPGDRDADHDGRADRLDAGPGRHGVDDGADGHVLRHPLQLGREVAGGDAVRRRPGASGPRSSRPSTSPTAWTRRRCPAALRANGIVDTDSYRKLGRNQLRIGTFPAVEPADVEALTACIDYVLERL